MNWYLQNGKESDVVISTRVRLSRNIKGIPFINKASKEELREVYDKVKEITPSLGYNLKFLSIDDMDMITKQSLVEKHLISPDFAKTKMPYTAVVINDDENICIMVNEEDHIKLQVFTSGLDIDNLLNLAIEIDEKMESLIPYSYHEKYGFLTACPTNVGTGLKISTLVHIPALQMTGNLNKMLNIINNLGMNVRGLYGEGTKAEGDIYQVSNNQTLGITEKEIAKNLNLLAQKIIDQERLARKYLSKNSLKLEDEVYRSYGILANARRLSEDENIELLSKVKLGTDLGIIKELNDKKVRELMLFTKPANMQKRLGTKLSVIDQEASRCEVVKQILQED